MIIQILHFLCQKISILHIFHTFISNGTFSLLILNLPSNNFAIFSQNGTHGSSNISKNDTDNPPLPPPPEQQHKQQNVCQFAQRPYRRHLYKKKLPVNSLKGPGDEKFIMGNFRPFRLDVLSVPKYHVISFFSYNSNISH